MWSTYSIIKLSLTLWRSSSSLQTSHILQRLFYGLSAPSVYLHRPRAGNFQLDFWHAASSWTAKQINPNESPFTIILDFGYCTLHPVCLCPGAKLLAFSEALTHLSQMSMYIGCLHLRFPVTQTSSRKCFNQIPIKLPSEVTIFISECAPKAARLDQAFKTFSTHNPFPAEKFLHDPGIYGFINQTFTNNKS